MTGDEMKKHVSSIANLKSFRDELLQDTKWPSSAKAVAREASARLVNWHQLSKLREQVEAQHPEFATDPRYDINAEAFDIRAYTEKISALQSAMLLKPPTIAVAWKHLTVKVPVVYGRTGIETVGSKVQEAVLALPLIVIDIGRWVWKNVFRQGLNSNAHLEAIVDDATGFLLPGETLLVLGPPGSGTSTFLNVLAQRNLSDYANISGTVEYNGYDIGTASRQVLRPLQHIVQFVEESDEHIPSLTVRDTFRFAADCLIPDFFPFAEKIRTDRVELLIKNLGLEHCANTVVGNELLRGISGGEKKRVTIGEMAVRQSSQIWLLDQWTRGLDAATAMDLQYRIAAVAKQRNIIVISVMQQPSQEIYDAYDKVMLMEAGKVLYFGPTNEAERYFFKLGYRRPRKRLLPEFLSTIGDPFESKLCIRPGYEDRVPRTPAEFAECYRNSSIAKHYRDMVESGSYLSDEQRQGFHQERYVEMSKLYVRNSLQRRRRQMLICLHREIRMIITAPFSFIVRFARYIILGVVIGALFFGINHDQLSVRVRAGLLFLVLLTVGVAGFSAIQQNAATLQIVRKQRRAGFYEMPPYFFALWLLDIPIQFVEVFIYLTLVTYMTKLQGGRRYGFAILIVWFTGMAVNTLLKAIGYASPYTDIALVLASLVIMLMVLSVGFLATPPNIPVYLRWVYWINPFHYAYEGIMLNEFDGLYFHCKPSELQPAGVPPAYQVCPIKNGIQYLHSTYSFSSNPSYKWIDFVIIAAYYVGFTIIAVILLVVVRWPPRPMYKSAREAACETDVQVFVESLEREHSISEQRERQVSNPFSERNVSGVE
ncbi:mitochondrial chaperone [Cyanidiococcus yangmingshanensis]|uniref:Mitochondrial chaperone n=1 Tax=Cyanidiococcus yangmingshanensis TaxID=2690220 RepID=A0A7J7IF86_9RHOD|nr:mitochondrial chaperone [Cyanidiococcus yangmingshanensis]